MEKRKVLTMESIIRSIAILTIIFALGQSGSLAQASSHEDNCEDAVAVGPGVHTGDTSGATDDGSTSCGYLTGADVWYKYSSAVDRFVFFSTCGSSFDTVLSIHSGCPGTTGNEIACNDDSCGVDEYQSNVFIRAVGGEEYFIRIAGYNGETGDYVLTITETIQEGADSCEDALPIGAGIYVGDTSEATSDGSSSCEEYEGIADVWYSYTPRRDGEVTLSLCDSGYDTILSVHSGCPGTADNEIVCNDDYCGYDELRSYINMPVTGGEEYLIRISGYDETGVYVLELTESLEPLLEVKWSQMPNMSNGYDTLVYLDGVADDWECINSEPVVKVTWWGSYLWYSPESPEPVSPPSGMIPEGFHIQIWEYSEPAESFSQPGSPLYSYSITSYTEEWYGAIEVWDGEGDYEHEFMYEAILPEPFYQELGTKYFISIYAAFYEQQYPWGWLNSADQWNDGAVYYTGRGWEPLFWDEVHPLGGQPMDMAFQLWTEASCEPSAIIYGPADVTICEGLPMSLSVVAQGTEPLYYEWFKNDVTLIEQEEESIRVGDNISGADTPVLTINPAELEDTGMYYCMVWNDCGEDVSTSASLTVMQLPSILIDPSDEAVTEGDPVTLSILAAGEEPLEYQWYKGEALLVDTPRISGTQTNTFDIAWAELSDEGSYSCTVSNLCGMDVSTTASLAVDEFVMIIDFEDDDGWTSGGAVGFFTVPGFRRESDYLTIQAVDASTYGYWESPRDMIPYIHDSIYRVVYTLRGSSEQQDAPTLRMRINTQSSTIIGALVVDSWLDASESPSDEPTSYTLYFDPRDQSGYQDNELTDDLNLGVDMLSFNEDDDTSCIFFLDDVVIDRFNVDAISGEVVYTYDTTEDFENWEFHGFPDSYTLPLNDRAAGSLVLVADNNSTDTYGFWESSRTANEVEIEPDVLYRAVFTVSSGSAQAEGPQARLRIGTESNKMSSVYVAYSNLDGLNSPKSLMEEEYQVFLYPPQSDVGAPADVNGLVFGIDMLNFTPEDDPNGDLVLERVEIQTIDPAILP